MTTARLTTLQTIVRWIAAVNFVGVGVLHFTHAHIFLLMMPPYLPAHEALVAISGFFEIAGGIGLLIERTRRAAAWGLLALVVAVFPANIYMATASVELPIEWLPQSETGRWVRLLFQPLIALEVWFAGLWRPSTTEPGDP